MEERLAALLREAGRAHHQAFIEVNGEDDAWPAWYAHYLIGPIRQMFGPPLDVATLAGMLETLEAERQRDGDRDWPRYYAARLPRLSRVARGETARA